MSSESVSDYQEVNSFATTEEERIVTIKYGQGVVVAANGKGYVQAGPISEYIPGYVERNFNRPSFVRPQGPEAGWGVLND
jgi:urocanate hydratase